MNESQQTGRSHGNKTQTDPAADATPVPPCSEQETIPPRSAAPNTADKEAMPERFGRYRIVTELGHGGMGSVYLAEDTELHRRVALKIPKFAQQDNPEMLQRFYREARSAATLNHPNICQVHDIGEYQGTPYISMAYIGGPPLSKLVGTPRLRSQRTIAKLVRKIAVGLAAAQNKGILHRDLKPRNILLDERNEPVITDFGLARQLEPSVDDRLTQEGTLIGTPAYMSPEQISGEAKRVGPASDVYSLGVILYELLTGQLPYKGPITSVIGQIVQGKPVPPSRLRPGLDQRLEAICLKMMAASVDHRYPDALEVVAALGHYLDETAQEAGSSVAKPAGPQATLEGHKQHIVGLLTQGQFPEAMERLQRLAVVQVAGGQEYAQWAHAELTRLKAMPAPVREKGPTLVAEAIKSLAQQDFAEVIELLGNVPPEYRTAEASQLLKEAHELAAEAGQLNERMQRAVRDRQYDGLRENVLDRLLELEPGNLQARDIYERLGTYGPGKKLRFDKAGNLLPAYSGSWWTDRLARLIYERLTRRKYQPRRRTGSRAASFPASTEPGSPDLPLAPIGIGLGILAIVGLLLGIVFVFRQGMETVRVELDPEVANDTTVTVWLDGKQMEISGLGETIKLKPGQHGYEIRRGDEVIRADQFTVVKDDETVLRINIDQAPDSELAQSTVDQRPNSPHPLPTTLSAEAPSPNQSLSSTGASDGAKPAPRIERLAELMWDPNKEDVYAWVSSDGLTICWTKEGQVKRPDDAGIWQATRKDPQSKFQNPRKILDGRQAVFTDDLLQAILLYRTSGGFMLHSALRSSKDERFPEPQVIPEFTSLSNPKSPWLCGDGRVLVVQQTKTLDETEFVMSTRLSPADRWEPPRPVAMKPDPRFTKPLTWPQLSADGLTLWFTHGPGVPLVEVVRATRRSTQEPFGDFIFVELDGQRLQGRCPRYVPSTKELFFTRLVLTETPRWQPWVVRNLERGVVGPAAGGGAGPP